MMIRRYIFILSFFLLTTACAQRATTWYSIIGSAFLDNAGYGTLQRLCDEAGGRFVGSPINERALDILQEELRALGMQPRLEQFTYPGWERGADEVRMLAPTPRTLRAVALGYVDRTPDIEAPLRFAHAGYADQYDGLDVNGKIVLITQAQPAGREELLRYEAIDIAAKHGARAILFINDRGKGITLSGVSNFQGRPSAIPAFSITMEEGAWLRRLLEKNIPVTMRVKTNSRCTEMKSANAVVTLPGESDEKIVIGAHFDGWDVGQGAVDNGIGSAILVDVARLLAKYSPRNRFTVEFVWFNGEELGLWGSKRYLELHAKEKIRAMINMDMTGLPTGFNAMGTDALLPFLESIARALNGFNLSTTIGNSPWTNSDHQPFMMRGIPTITPNAHLEKEMVEHYHDFGDTFEKVDKRYISDAAAVVAILAAELANDNTVKLARRTDKETIEFLQKHKLESRLRKQKEWRFE